MSSTFRTARGVKTAFKKLFSQKYLLYTNTTISVLMSCTGDGLQQNYQIVQKEIPSWDRRRSRDVGVTGILIGPFCHYWYIFLDWWLPGRSARVVTKKLLVDQLICSPIIITSFLYVTSYLEGKRGRELKNELLEKGKTLYAAEWIVWPPAQALNFYLLPTRFRVLFDNVVSFGFDWYFSYVKYGKCDESVEKASESTDAELLEPEDKVIHVSRYGSHMPFLHIQAARAIQDKRDHIHWDNWNEMFFMGHHDESDKERAKTENAWNDINSETIVCGQLKDESNNIKNK